MSTRLDYPQVLLNAILDFNKINDGDIKYLKALSLYSCLPSDLREKVDRRVREFSQKGTGLLVPPTPPKQEGFVDQVSFYRKQEKYKKELAFYNACKIMMAIIDVLDREKIIPRRIIFAEEGGW